MTTPVTPDAVEAAARALHERDPYCYHDGSVGSWEDLSVLAKACYTDLATAALAAAAPLIAKQTLEEAYFNGHLTAAALTACAATLTPKEK